MKQVLFWCEKWLKGSETGKNWLSNGICESVKRKLANFETENHWVYIGNKQIYKVTCSEHTNQDTRRDRLLRTNVVAD